MAFDIKAWSDYGVWFSSSEAHRGRAGQALVLFVVPLTGILRR
jgi:hypothetical protein